MNNNVSNPNLEWKKGTIGEQEKLTLKTNVKKAVEYNAKKDEIIKTPAPLPADLPQGLKKIRNKIKNIDEEDDEEDNGQIVIDPLSLAADNSLLNALHEDEKKMLKQLETNNLMKQQLETEKVGTISLANNIARQAGFKGLKKSTIREGLADNTINPEKLKETLKKELKNEIKDNNKNWSELSDKDLINLMEGVNKIKTIGGKDSLGVLKDMDVKEVAEYGREKNNELEIARTICEKTGRKECKVPKKEKKEVEKTMVKNKNINRKVVQDRDRS